LKVAAMEMADKLSRDAEVEQALAQNLEDEVRAWRAARSQRRSVTASGVPVLRRMQRARRLPQVVWS
jgi:hypothetical protein